MADNTILDQIPENDVPVTEEIRDGHYLEEVNLTEEELKTVEEYANNIDLRDSNLVLSYGTASQKKMAEFSDAALEGVKNKDLGEVGSMISGLVAELKGFSAEGQKKGLFGFLRKKAGSITRLKAQYAEAEDNVEKICTVLESHQNTLTRDVIMLDKMYDTNLEHFKELTMYILAGKKKLEEERSETLSGLKQKAQESGLAEDAQAANDFENLCERFEKKLYDLELTREISVQMAPQLRLIQNNDALMVDRIQSTLTNTIPLWKNQMVLALGMAHSQEAMQAQQQVNDLTNALLLQNAETLKTGTVEIAKESERSLIDIETVKKTNEQLMTTLDEVLKIQEEGRIERAKAENELGLIEAQLKNKLLEIRDHSLSPAEQAVPEADVVSEQ